MPIPAYVDGDLRIQFLSSTLVRIEQKGPKGFEDRPSFTAVGRSWTGVPFKKQGANLVTAGYTVSLPAQRDGIKGVKVLVNGKAVYTVGDLPKNDWLPAPGKTGPVWPLADSPRMIPPAGGAIPKNLGGPLGETSGYDTGNNAPDLYLFVTKNPKTLRKDFLKLTGPIPLVPRYTLGFWDSRWYPYSDKMALACIEEYRRRGLPLDLFVCDTDWRVGASKGYGVDKKLFPDMPAFLRAAHEKGVRTMFNDHPEPQAPTALDPQETVYRWNGLTDLLRQGLDVWWYDRNWSTALHQPMRGIDREAWGASVFHDVTKAFRPEIRPLIMANVDGIDNGIRNKPPHPSFHRYPIPWTGDTTSSWGYLRRAVENGVDEGVIGMLPYVHEDAAGHVGNPAPELYTRFMQYCALSPVLRVHCTFGLNRYPWSFGPQAEEATIEAIRFRYRLLPTLYSAVHRVSQDGTPILRRLDLEWPNLSEAVSSRQYLLGDDLLVSPVTDPDAPEVKPLVGDFKAEYFSNKDLTGEPALTRSEQKVDVDWGQGSPDNAIPVNNFSARWTGKIGPMPRTTDYTFAVSSDDGARLWIDGKLVLDQWKPQDSVLNVAKIHLEAGKIYDLRMEYFEEGGGANAHLLWSGGEAPRKGPKPWSFWVPPGTWIDPWTGGRVVGPKTLSVPATLRRVPTLIRDGAIFFLGDDHVKNADEQLKKPITIEAYPGPATARKMVEDDGISVNPKVVVRPVAAVRTATGVSLTIGASAGDRDLVVRIHLRAGESVKSVTMGGAAAAYRVEKPSSPAAGLGTLFAARGGSVVEIKLPKWPSGFSSTIEVKTK
jgi:hypothetical protein